MLEKNRIFSLVLKKITEREFKTFFRAIALARSSVMRVDSRSRIDFTVSYSNLCAGFSSKRGCERVVVFKSTHVSPGVRPLMELMS